MIYTLSNKYMPNYFAKITQRGDGITYTADGAIDS